MGQSVWTFQHYRHRLQYIHACEGDTLVVTTRRADSQKKLMSRVRRAIGRHQGKVYLKAVVEPSCLLRIRIYLLIFCLPATVPPASGGGLGKKSGRSFVDFAAVLVWSVVDIGAVVQPSKQ